MILIHTNRRLKRGLLILGTLLVHCLQAQNDFRLRFENAERPSRHNLKIAVSDSFGNEGYLPVSIFKGKVDGPVFTIISGVHGLEYAPIIAVQQIMQEVDLDLLYGTIIFIPIASRGSFYTRTPYKNGEDGVNLNGAFPGNKDGSITQKTAYLITKNIIPVSDVFLDIHGGDAPEDLLPFICYYNNKNRPEQTQLAKELSDVSGFEYVVSYPYTITDEEPAKYVFKQAVQDGKTGLSIEAGKLGIVQEEAVALIKKGVFNMLGKMKMYRKVSDSNHTITRLNDQVYIKSKTKGIFYSSLKAGDSVQKEQVVGYTTDEFGAVLEEYKASKTGLILYMLATPTINKGETLMCLSSFISTNE
ncbi:Succinate dehydrogenase subunit [Croceitalea dokdonensis DOKDO 023]|uniref:Succinate dehydrogenase subunit n=1 Tax=Croceitalea dokdonensis DOKDO 023 TaxID=1300341 RepID=A0A0P7A8Z1_9FLAO|nr:succinylglutamate desuccinylase/aspartoacylase family protein [Croceitalea dokdonensis]KPM33289.1 Succinate dehydrogenase subunit [Croceitalea dokdonensis DOKDO 023]